MFGDFEKPPTIREADLHDEPRSSTEHGRDVVGEFLAGELLAIEVSTKGEVEKLVGYGSECHKAPPFSPFSRWASFLSPFLGLVFRT